MTNQNYEAGEGIFFEPPVEKNASYYRAKARTHLKGSFWLSTLISLITSGIPAMIYSVIATVVIGIMVVLTVLLRDTAFVQYLPLIEVVPLLVGGFAVYALVGGPLSVGMNRAFLQVIDGEKPSIAPIFTRFFENYGKVVGTYLIYFALAMVNALPFFACMAVAIIPGIHMLIKLPVFLILYALGFFLVIRFSYTYAFVFTIRAEYPEIGAWDAMRSAKALMVGNRWRLFCLQLSFIGWELLLMLATVVTCGTGAYASYPLHAYMMTAYLEFYSDISNRDAAKETEFPSINPEDYDPNTAQW